MRRELRRLAESTPDNDKHNAAYFRAVEANWRDGYASIRATGVKDYRRVPQGEMEEWRQAKNRDALAVERLAWEHDHPGKEFPGHECGLSDREYTGLQRWRRQRERRAQRA